MSGPGRPKTQGGPCCVDGCENASVIRDMCRKHYHQWLRTGKTWMMSAQERRDMETTEQRSAKRHEQGQAVSDELKRLREAYNGCLMHWRARLRLRQQITALENGMSA